MEQSRPTGLPLVGQLSVLDAHGRLSLAPSLLHYTLFYATELYLEIAKTSKNKTGARWRGSNSYLCS